MNVLSIDWDYFIDCTEDEILTLFPDCGNENISCSLSSHIWAIRYADSFNPNIGASRRIMDIGVREKALAYVIWNVLPHMSKTTFIQFSDSHASIYDLVMNNSEGKKVKIYNLDHHSDTYNIGDELNCGNWANKLDDASKLEEFIWIGNTDSNELKRKLDLKSPYRVTDDITVLGGVKQWDIISISRSSLWTPPHLDDRFLEFANWYNNLGINFDISQMKSRYTEDFRQNVETYRHPHEELLRFKQKH